MPPLKLPRKIEADPRHSRLEELLARDLRPLWEHGEVEVAHIEWRPSLEKSLVAALNFKQLERGIENIGKTLLAEKRGLDALQKKQGTPSANRVSRLLIIADDGAERFNRECESLLHHNSDRLLGLRINASSAQIGEKLFGKDKSVKALLVSDKDAVVQVLLSLLDP